MTQQTEIDDRVLAYVCYNCGHLSRNVSNAGIRDLFERVQPGDTMPAGECEVCGALAYLVEVRTSHLVAHTLSCTCKEEQ